MLALRLAYCGILLASREGWALKLQFSSSSTEKSRVNSLNANIKYRRIRPHMNGVWHIHCTVICADKARKTSDSLRLSS